MWSSLSYTLAPLTKLVSIKRKFQWIKVEQDTFYEIKRIVAYNTLLTYTNFIENFKIYTGASAFQLGAVISHVNV